MTQKIRFGQYMRDISVVSQEISYNALAPKIKRDGVGKIIPYDPPRVTLKPKDIYRILKNYTSGRFMEQFSAVTPLAVYLALFQLIVLHQMVEGFIGIAISLVAVMVGLMFFMEGLQLGLMPFGETIGVMLPKKSTLPVVLTIAFLLGVGVTFAEPAIGALKTAGQLVDVNKAPYLFLLLNDWSGVLVLVVGAGVGLAAILGTMRFIRGWSLKPMIYAALAPALGMTAYASGSDYLEPVLGLAWDCGAVTTGPVTVPLVLSLGIGIAASAGKGSQTLSGFGIVTLASIFPIIGVLGLSIFVVSTVPVESIIQGAASMAATTTVAPWYEVSPGVDIILAFRAILPLVVFLFLVLNFLLKEKIQNGGIVAYGIALTIIGMATFNVGLTYGLSALGEQSGSLLPSAFTTISAVPDSPIYAYIMGMILALAFAWFLGFGATLAEPALNALGATVENLTQGVFKKSTLMYAVSFGVAFGIAIGLAKIVFNISLPAMLIPAYGFAIVLTYFSTEEFVNIAWDSAGVTTGPITVPLVLAMGLGVGGAVDVVEGFGMLSMASIGPIISVMMTGLWVRFSSRFKKSEEEVLAEAVEASS
ncbi:MAG: DUF1538 domain-containing protein [Magnetococcales bacterium]|nr:DUF1538 domain-containing protein [Magnetococcales bacterium]